MAWGYTPLWPSPHSISVVFAPRGLRTATHFVFRSMVLMLLEGRGGNGYLAFFFGRDFGLPPGLARANAAAPLASARAASRSTSPVTDPTRDTALPPIT